jgi:hypothetical protein
MPQAGAKTEMEHKVGVYLESRGSSMDVWEDVLQLVLRDSRSGYRGSSDKGVA